MKKAGVAILGLGVVGGGTYDILTQNREYFKKLEVSIGKICLCGLNMFSYGTERLVLHQHSMIVSFSFQVADLKVRKKKENGLLQPNYVTSSLSQNIKAHS